MGHQSICAVGWWPTFRASALNVGLEFTAHISLVGCPLRFDFYAAVLACQIVPKAAPRPVSWLLYQSKTTVGVYQWEERHPDRSEAEWRDLVFRGKTQDSSTRATERRSLGMTFIVYSSLLVHSISGFGIIRAWSGCGESTGGWPTLSPAVGEGWGSQLSLRFKIEITPIRSRLRAVHSDSIFTTPSTPVA